MSYHYKNASSFSSLIISAAAQTTRPATPRFAILGDENANEYWRLLNACTRRYCRSLRPKKTLEEELMRSSLRSLPLRQFLLKLNLNTDALLLPNFRLLPVYSNPNLYLISLPKSIAVSNRRILSTNPRGLVLSSYAQILQRVFSKSQS